jgi:two-component system OmpR family response regulator
MKNRSASGELTFGGRVSPKRISITEDDNSEFMRRGKRSTGAVLRAGDLELNRRGRAVRRAGRRIELSPKEFALLECLMCNAGRRVSRSMIIENVWKLSSDTMTNVVDVYINNLRKKIDEGFGEKLIRTVRGVGYQLGSSEDDIT